MIVGGGPAGSACAITCAAAGLRTAVVERSVFPRDRPGETLHPGAEPLFATLGVRDEVEAAGFPRHSGHRVAWDEPARFVEFGADAGGRWLGFHAWRARLDAILLDRAARLGAAVVQPRHAVLPRVEGGRVVGVTTDAGLLAARFVVDAAGGSHWLARRLGVPLLRASARLVVRYGYGPMEPSEEEAALAADAGGWTWTAPVRAGVHAWTRLRADGAPDARSWRPPGFAAGTRARSADVSWRMAARPAGHGYYMAGDAAAVLDPAASHGVLKALMSGIFAGHSIVGVLTGNATERDAASGYGRWVADWFAHDTAALITSYRRLVDAGVWNAARCPWLAASPIIPPSVRKSVEADPRPEHTPPTSPRVS